MRPTSDRMSSVTADGDIVVTGADLPDDLAVVPIGALASLPRLVPMAGSWERDAGGARFRPRFAPVPGTTFAVLERTVGGAWREIARVGIPAADLTPTAVVDRIGPDVEVVPANLLRFSVAFSGPMDEGSAAGRIHLLDQAGAELLGALHDMPPELWDRDRTRLTVLLEPGRIKRGLQPNQQAGPPLREGASVTLVVDDAVRDAAGRTLARAAHRSYRVGAAERRRIDPGSWSIRWPEAPGDPLVILADRPLDAALGARYLRVTDQQGRRLRGHADAGARTWTFPSPAGSEPQALRVDARLEDLAGNSVRRVFDRDLESRGDDGFDGAEVLVVRPSARGGASSCAS